MYLRLDIKTFIKRYMSRLSLIDLLVISGLMSSIGLLICYYISIIELLLISFLIILLWVVLKIVEYQKLSEGYLQLVPKTLIFSKGGYPKGYFHTYIFLKSNITKIEYTYSTIIVYGKGTYTYSSTLFNNYKVRKEVSYVVIPYSYLELEYLEEACKTDKCGVHYNTNCTTVEVL